MPSAHSTAPPERPEATGALSRLVDGFLALERWVHATYLERLRSPRLVRADPHVRRAYGFVRRATAVPIYLRQQLELRLGPCGDETAHIATWGRTRDLRPVLRAVLDGPPLARAQGDVALPPLLRAWRHPAEDVDLLVAATTPVLAGAFRRRGFLIVPAAVRMRASLDELRAAPAIVGKSLRSDLRRVARTGYRLETWSASHERAVLFHERYLLPHARRRFAEDASLPALEQVERAFAAGLALAILAPGRDAPDALCLVRPRGDTLSLLRLGVCDGDPAIVRAGGLTAVYAFAARFAEERGLRFLDAGYSRPWLDRGAARYKWKWGFRPVPNPAQTLEWAVRVVRPEGACARRLAERQPIVRAGGRLAPLPAGDLCASRRERV